MCEKPYLAWKPVGLRAGDLGGAIVVEGAALLQDGVREEGVLRKPELQRVAALDVRGVLHNHLQPQTVALSVSPQPLPLSVELSILLYSDLDPSHLPRDDGQNTARIALVTLSGS